MDIVIFIFAIVIFIFSFGAYLKYKKFNKLEWILIGAFILFMAAVLCYDVITNANFV